MRTTNHLCCKLFLVFKTLTRRKQINMRLFMIAVLINTVFQTLMYMYKFSISSTTLVPLLHHSLPLHSTDPLISSLSFSTYQSSFETFVYTKENTSKTVMNDSLSQTTYITHKARTFICAHAKQ